MKLNIDKPNKVLAIFSGLAHFADRDVQRRYIESVVRRAEVDLEAIDCVRLSNSKQLLS